ncbi:MAG: hypothetical protein FWC26_06060, partial [Fibromonadales bacterium]|nr:hypothetical protein [Fibromonadales bacterium]
IENALLAPMIMDELEDSSDNIKVGELFYEFLCENFPKDKLAELKTLPRPEFKIDAMETCRLGTCKDKTILINQRLVLEAFSAKNYETRFILLLAMLMEYGRFLNEDGKAFMNEFIENSDDKLLKNDSFKFADFIVPNSKGNEQKFTVEVSGLNYEQKLEILDFLKSSES